MLLYFMMLLYCDVALNGAKDSKWHTKQQKILTGHPRRLQRSHQIPPITLVMKQF